MDVDLFVKGLLQNLMYFENLVYGGFARSKSKLINPISLLTIGLSLPHNTIEGTLYAMLVRLISL